LRGTKRAVDSVFPIKAELDYLRLELSRPNLKELQSKFTGKRCFIIGNGPSLNLSDIEKLKGEYTFASNKIYLLFEKTAWRPYFYSVEDHLVLSQNFEQIESVEAKYKIFPNYPIEVANSFPGSIYFKLKYEDFYPNAPEFSNNLMTHLHWGSSIVYTQMQLAAAMGFEKIYLIGVDYSYKVPSRKDGKILTSEGEVNHFHKDYRKPGEKWYQPNLHYHEKSFTKAYEFAQKNGFEILNATRGGKLEIFPRVDFNNLF